MLEGKYFLLLRVFLIKRNYSQANTVLQKLEKRKIDCPKEILDIVKRKCNIQHIEEWKNVPKGFFRFFGAKNSFFTQYKTLSSVLREVYPEEYNKIENHDEIPWEEIKQLDKRPRIPGGYWKIKQTRFDFMNELVNKYQLSKHDLSSVSLDMISKNSGRGLVDLFRLNELKKLVEIPPTPQKIAKQIETIMKFYNINHLIKLQRNHIINKDPDLLKEYKNLNNLIKFAFPNEYDDYVDWKTRLKDPKFDIRNTMDKILKLYRPDLINENNVSRFLLFLFFFLNF